jgi:uncharacterized protein (TIGR02588 family)
VIAMPRREQRSSVAAHASGTPASEWTAAAIGLILFLIALGSSIYRGVWTEDSPPDIIVHVTSVAPVHNEYLIQFRAENRGGRTAEGVVIEARLIGRDGRTHTSHTTIEYLPGGSVREGGLFVSMDPAQSQLTIRALGYETP